MLPKLRVTSSNLACRSGDNQAVTSNVAAFFCIVLLFLYRLLGVIRGYLLYLRCKCGANKNNDLHLKMNIMATVNFYLDTRRLKGNDKYPIKLRIQNEGKFLLSTGFDSNIEAWEENSYNKCEPNYKYKNAALRNMFSLVENELILLQSTGKLKGMSDKRLKEYLEVLLGKNGKQEKKFIDYLNEFISLKSNPGTKTVYSTTKNKLLEFDPNCTFETMDRKWLATFENWLSESGMKINAYAIHLRNIRAVFNYAIDEEITTLYPFRKFKIKKEETKKRSLTVEQLRELINYPCEDFENRYRDLFLLSFYLIGINIGDMLLLKRENLINGRIEYHRQKTGKLYSIKLEPEAQSIFERYKGEKYLLNVLDEYNNYKDFISRINKGLKNLGPCERKGLGGKKIRYPLFPNLSTYWARHTWATIAASLDIPKETISAGLGHEIGSDVTSIYIRFDQKKVDDANRMIIDYVIGESRS